MQIYLNSTINKPNYFKYNSPKKNISVTSPNPSISPQITFMGASTVQKTVSSQIAHEKEKLLNHFKDILKLNVPKLSPEERIMSFIRRAHATLVSSMRREDEIQREMELLVSTNLLNAQQKLDRAQQLKREFMRLGKIKVPEDRNDAPPPKDNYDYALINKFKQAVLNDNYDLAKIHEEHYRDLKNITTVKEFKEKYPTIRIPQDPKEVIVDKILKSFNRDFYYDLDELFENGDEQTIIIHLLKFFDNYFEELAEQFKDRTAIDLLNMFGNKVTERVLRTLTRLKEFDAFETIPTNKMNIPPILTNADKELLNLDYDALVIGTLKQMYLENKKLNKIEYKEGDKTINIASIKASEYCFEKIPDKTRRLINDALKPARLQRDYTNFTEKELKARLKHYAYTDLSNDEIIFSNIIDFDACKFTEEDKQYLIKFLQILDDISDGKISLKSGSDTIVEKNLKPHGTFKLNELERKEFEEKTKKEQQNIRTLTILREDFNKLINTLYELNLPDIAESFSKYYPENYSEKVLKETQNAINLIRKSIENRDAAKIRTKFLRREIFNDYATNRANSEELSSAQKYADSFVGCDTEDKLGQYLINRELIENYPASKKMFPKPKILDRIIEKFSHDKNLATEYLCKYEDYLFLDKTEQQSILKILEIFNDKNPNDRIILKSIVEEDYIKSDTTLTSDESSNSTQATISAIAKKDILAEYKFPSCIELYEAFENALTSTATEYGTSGIKKTGTNNSALDYKIELKIMGYPDRLFSSRNDYVFDIYSDRGLH